MNTPFCGKPGCEEPGIDESKPPARNLYFDRFYAEHFADRIPMPFKEQTRDSLFTYMDLQYVFENAPLEPATEETVENMAEDLVPDAHLLLLLQMSTSGSLLDRARRFREKLVHEISRRLTNIDAEDSQ